MAAYDNGSSLTAFDFYIHFHIFIHTFRIYFKQIHIYMEGVIHIFICWVISNKEKK